MKILSKNFINLIFLLSILLINSHADAVEFVGKFIQGHFILGKTEQGSKVHIDKKKFEFLKMVILFLE